MTQSKRILGVRLGIIHACPMQSQHQITSIRRHSALLQMMKMVEGGERKGSGEKEKKKAKGGNRKSEAEIDRLLCFWREEEALQDEVGKHGVKPGDSTGEREKDEEEREK